MNNELTFDQYVRLNIDYSKIVNSTLDIEKDSILCIDLNNSEKLDKLILEGLKKGSKLVLTSANSTIENENVYRYENFDEVFQTEHHPFAFLSWNFGVIYIPGDVLQNSPVSLGEDKDRIRTILMCTS